MKNLVFLFSFFVLALSANAQIQLKATRATSGAVSGASELTVTDAGTDTLFTPSTSKGKLAIFVVTFTRTSGTAGGTATLQGSIDGTDWVTVGSAYTVTNVPPQRHPSKCLPLIMPSPHGELFTRGREQWSTSFEQKFHCFNRGGTYPPFFVWMRLI